MADRHSKWLRTAAFFGAVGLGLGTACGDDDEPGGSGGGGAAAGAGGVAGSGGIAGADASAGAGGQAGAAAAAGTSGSGGGAGTGGAGGVAGSGGSAGSGGVAGSAGASGSGGVAGTAGAAGTAGGGGVAGGGGASGSAGAGGGGAGVGGAGGAGGANPCGNGTLDSGEECDDANRTNLDGCDASCRYEMVTRMNQLEIVSGTAPSFCSVTTNRLAEAISPGIIQILNADLRDSIAAGSLNVLLQFLALDDLTGVDDTDLTLGVMSGVRDPRKGVFDPAAIDWWFLADPATVDASGRPTSTVPGASLSSRALAVGPATFTLPFAGQVIDLLDGHIQATVNDAPAPDVPSPPPAALAAGLAVFQALTASGTDLGLCGNATVQSLAQIPLPDTFTPGGLVACVEASTASCLTTPSITSHQYTYCGGGPVGPGCNSLLDAIVGGCFVNEPDCIEAFLPSQPDVGTGGNAPATLVNDPSNSNKVTITEPNDAYSAYFRFDAQRVHLTNNLP